MSIIHQRLNKHSPGAVTTWHSNPDKPGELISQKTFDRSIAIESATQIRNEVNQSGKELVLGARIPLELYFQWIKEGKIGDEDFHEGSPAISREKLNRLLSGDYSRLKCIDGTL